MCYNNTMQQKMCSSFLHVKAEDVQGQPQAICERGMDFEVETNTYR